MQSLIDRTGCTKIVIAVGQWPASYKMGLPDYGNRGPVLLGQFYRQTKVMLQNLRRELPDHIEIFARSIHYNPIGDVIGGCTPRDWRNPLVIDGYNAVIERAVEELGGGGPTRSNNITFLDTNFLVGPMWDSSQDWCHLNDQVQHPEALYIAAVTLGTIKLPPK